MFRSPFADKGVPDAVKGHWVDRNAPMFLRPYLRLARIERPIGWWLLLLPCWWSAALAAAAAGASYPDAWHLVLFLIGAVAMRGAGSTYNDIVDRELDARVARTRDRPLPSGRVSLRGAVIFVGLQCLVGLLVLVQFNGFTIALGFASIGIVLFYPFMKRFIWMPQFVLGLCFAWGALMGWAAEFGALALAPVLLYAAAISWTIGFDTIYAIQDIEDDEIVGIKSAARYFGENVKPAVAGFYALSVALVTGAVAASGIGPTGYLAAAAFAAHLAWQVVTMDREDGPRALKLFRSNRDAGLILFAGFSLAALIG
ncbi:4-hydroxybenzoate octaprenyltransferase [Saliniramus sp.]|uniref:4-hydroxybenzoate octaprenyltransferase n=1 Tax=Saliniramus sp. TaxID=2986772 RepID=UPI0032C22196